MQASSGEIEGRTYWRLVILFDGAGLVRNARIEAASCIAGSDSKQYECVDVAGRDVPRMDPVDDSYARELVRGRRFAPAGWIPGVRGFHEIPAGNAALPVRGTLVVGASGILFFSSLEGARATPLVTIAYSRIAEVRVDSYGRSEALVVRRKNGSCETFSLGGVLVDRAATQAAAAQIDSARKAAAANEP